MENQDTLPSVSISFHPISHDVDCMKRLRLTSFLQKTQDIAETHANLYGCGYRHLIEKNIVWVLSRMKMEMTRMPDWNEPVRLDTWHKRVERIFALRDFILYDSCETPIIKATSAWLLMDIRSRRMLRVEHILPHLAQVNIPLDAIKTVPDKLAPPVKDGLVPMKTHKVCYSDVDLLNHVNNTKYVEWALDCLPSGDNIPNMHDMTSFQINFNVEARFQDCVNMMYNSSLDNKTHYVEGTREEQNLFQCLCRFGN